MEESTLLWVGVAAGAAFVGWKLFGGDAVSAILPVASTGLMPTVATVASQTAQQSQVATGVQTIAPAPVAAPITAGTVTPSGVYSGTQGVYFPVGNSYSDAEKQRIIDDMTGKLAQGLPAVINPSVAGSLLQVPQSLIDNMKMGGSVGTNFGTFSLQPAGMLEISKVSIYGEQDLVNRYRGMTWAQYRAAAGLSGLGKFVRSMF